MPMLTVLKTLVIGFGAIMISHSLSAANVGKIDLTMTSIDPRGPIPMPNIPLNFVAMERYMRFKAPFLDEEAYEALEDDQKRIVDDNGKFMRTLAVESALYIADGGLGILLLITGLYLDKAMGYYAGFISLVYAVCQMGVVITFSGLACEPEGEVICVQPPMASASKMVFAMNIIVHFAAAIVAWLFAFKLPQNVTTKATNSMA